MTLRHKQSDCMGRIPFASLIALVICLVGVGMFCAMMSQAVDATVEQARRILLVDPPWLDRIRMIFISVAVIMSIVALILLIVGALATGSTRTKVYSGVKARLGGRAMCALFLVITYILNIVWIGILTISVVLAFTYLVFSTLCMSVGSLTQDSALNFTVLSPLLTRENKFQNLVVKGADLQEFCALTDTASTWYYIGYFGSVVVVLSLIHYMICLSANYSHIKSGKHYVELQEIWQMEDMNNGRGSAPILGRKL